MVTALLSPGDVCPLKQAGTVSCDPLEGEDKDERCMKGNRRSHTQGQRMGLSRCHRAPRRWRWLFWVGSLLILSRPVQSITSHFPVRMLRVPAAGPAKREGSPSCVLVVF